MGDSWGGDLFFCVSFDYAGFVEGVEFFVGEVEVFFEDLGGAAAE